MVLRAHQPLFSHTSWIRLRSKDKCHTIWLASFSFSLNHSMSPYALLIGGAVFILEDTICIRMEGFHNLIKVIQKNSAFITNKTLKRYSEEKDHRPLLLIKFIISRIWTLQFVPWNGCMIDCYMPNDTCIVAAISAGASRVMNRV